MTKEQQDIAWAGLPKDARNQIISSYFCKRDSDTEYNKGYVDAILHIYGIHNLTSDTEPEEMLMIPRYKVVVRYEDDKDVAKITRNEDTRLLCEARMNLLANLFGDKCLPDKELEHRLEQPIQASVQVEPKYKFSLGQKVVLHFYGGEIGTISERFPPEGGIVWNCYKVKELPYHLWRENELDPL